MRSFTLLLPLFSFPLAIILTGCQGTSPQPNKAEAAPMTVVEEKAELIPARVVPIPSGHAPQSEVIVLVEPDVMAAPIEPQAPVVIEAPVISVEELIVEAPVAPVAPVEESIVVDEFEPAVELTQGVRVMLDNLRDTVSLSAEQYYEIEQLFADRGVEYKALLKQRNGMDSAEFDQQKSQLFSRYYRLYSQVLTAEQRKAWAQSKN